jgi:dipeptidyl-peptidase-4
MPGKIMGNFLLCATLAIWCTSLNAQPLQDAWAAKILQLDAPQDVPELSGLRGINWNKEGNGFTQLQNMAGGYQIAAYDPDHGMAETVLVSSSQLVPADRGQPLSVASYTWYPEHQKILLFTNPKRVWRARTRGDFWIFDRASGKLMQLGVGLPAASLQFAKISPDGNMAAFVSNHNIYVENLADGAIKALTTDGTEKIINGTFDWAYEEELFCRDGFRWSPDSRSIAYWQVNATAIRDFLMIDNTDSMYSFTVPVQYPLVGYDPSSVRIGVVDLATAKTTWMKIPGDPVQHYLPKMDWAGNSSQIMVQQFNRKQDTTCLYLVEASSGLAKKVYREGDTSWVDLNYFWQYDRPGWEWINDGKQFLWTTEKDGWRHIYRLNRDGSGEKLITKTDFDVIDVVGIDRALNLVYFTASPDNATQQYLYETDINGTGKARRITGTGQEGTHTYLFSKEGAYALHGFSNHYTPSITELIKVQGGQVMKSDKQAGPAPDLIRTQIRNPMSFFQVKIQPGITMDGWMIRPVSFDSTKKYPVLFYVYGEPAMATVRDVFSPNPWFQKLADSGYVIISMDNRGTPAPKGTLWRKAIYHNIGILNVDDQARGARQVLKWPWVDSSRIAVWGWSGGAASTQMLLFRYPDIYKTGMAVAAVSNLLYYDNIYEERYMGVLPEDLKYYQQGSTINHASGLHGNLLIVHGSGDDNVHYQNQEALINALVKSGKSFQMMEYPNRTHGISEGPGTTAHLYALLTSYLQIHCPGGPR